MIEIATLALNQPWMKFLQQDLALCEPIKGEKGENIPVHFSSISKDYNPEQFLASVSEKKIVITTHQNQGELSEYFMSNGVSVINGGKLADAAHTNPELITLQAARARFLVSGERAENSKDYVLIMTHRGMIDTWLEFEEHRGLYRGLVPSEEGITLRQSSDFDADITKKIETMVEGWGFLGFLFISVSEEDGQKFVNTITPFGPQAFWPAFARGFNGNLLKFLVKLTKSRKKISNFKFEPITVLKLTLPPYPYHRTPWVENEQERAIVERHLNDGSAGVTFVEPEAAEDVVWLDVSEGDLISGGPEIAFACAPEKDLERIAAIAKAISPDGISLQYKGDL